MPNCDFYGTLDDHAALLNWLFEGEACHVYELYSDFEHPLRRFSNSSDVVAQFDRRHRTGEKWSEVHLALYVLGAGPAFVPRHVLLDARVCDGATYRYAAKGWGLVQLYLGGLTPANSLRSSHTNHFTQAKAWAQAGTGQPVPDSWDFKKITSFSSRLNRHIRKRRVGESGGRAILPGAHQLWQAGATLLP